MSVVPFEAGPSAPPTPLKEASVKAPEAEETLATVTQLHPDLAPEVAPVEVQEIEKDAEAIILDALRTEVRTNAQQLAREFNEAIADEPEAEIPVSARDMKLELTPANKSDYTTDTGWAPGEVFTYKSNDPYREQNPGLAQAGTDLIEGVIELTQELRKVMDESEIVDTSLAYVDSQRAKGGKKATIVTQELMNADPAIGDWIAHLPDAERLRPVAHPAMDGSTVILVDGEFQEIPKTKALSALVGGSGDGRAVIERETWEAMVGGESISQEATKDGKLVITSLGTGTGEPAMDTGIAIMQERFGDNFQVTLNGFDINPDSLEVARHMATRKTEETGNAAQVSFEGAVTNILSEEGIQQAVGASGANLIEAIGFSEYVPSAFATRPEEQKQREFMERLGCLSAEEFYGKIYENMPEGSVFLTGNMRDDSPEAPFVVDGLGWKGIIQRSTEDYLKILERAGIPSEAVRFYVPDAEQSAGVYNLVAITKQ